MYDSLKLGPDADSRCPRYGGRMDVTTHLHGTCTRRDVLGAGLTTAAADALGLASAPNVASATFSAGGLNFRDGHGLTVRTARRLDSEHRLVSLCFGTREVTGWENGGPGVNVLLPFDYDDFPDKRYPVVYLFHGGGIKTGFRQWYTMSPLGCRGSLLLQETAGTEAIFVMPDISKGCWGLDARHEFFWLRRNWETFHLDQLVPWIDTNFRTLGTTEGRAVLGYSMGGFAALHHVAKRPELFSAVSAYSAPSDLGHPSFQTYMYVSPVADKLAPGALLGKPVKGDTSKVPLAFLEHLPPLAEGGDPAVWDSENPRAHIDSYRGKRISLIAGDVTKDGNEGPVIEDQPQFAALLRANGIAVTQYQVVGDHSQAVRRAFPQDLPGVLDHLAQAG